MFKNLPALFVRKCLIVLQSQSSFVPTVHSHVSRWKLAFIPCCLWFYPPLYDHLLRERKLVYRRSQIRYFVSNSCRDWNPFQRVTEVQEDVPLESFPGLGDCAETGAFVNILLGANQTFFSNWIPSEMAEIKNLKIRRSSLIWNLFKWFGRNTRKPWSQRDLKPILVDLESNVLPLEPPLAGMFNR